MLKANKSKIDPQTEVEIHRKLTEKNRHRFVKIIEDFVENDNVYLVMEYCAEGSLKNYMTKHGPMGVLLGLFRLGVKFIHEFVLLLNYRSIKSLVRSGNYWYLYKVKVYLKPKL
jgi:hypothetical protein